jgi:hypothetical protein
MDYLLDLLNSSEYPFDVVHDFIFDRTRSVRQDLSIQNLVNEQAIHIYEDVVRSKIDSFFSSSSCMHIQFYDDQYCW